MSQKVDVCEMQIAPTYASISMSIFPFSMHVSCIWEIQENLFYQENGT